MRTMTFFKTLFVLHGLTPLFLQISAFQLNPLVRAHSKSSSSISSTMTEQHFTTDIPMGPPDSILGIAAAFRGCTDPNKVNVCVGAYRDSDGKPWVLPSVRSAEQRMIDQNANKEYAPIEGDSAYVELAVKFAYGDDVDLSKLAAVQTLSGTGACRVGGEFFSRFLPKGTKIYLPDPTWGNHIAIFKNCGLDVQQYRYYNYKSNVSQFLARHHSEAYGLESRDDIIGSCFHLTSVASICATLY
jgi:hypothetical protein